MKPFKRFTQKMRLMVRLALALAIVGSLQQGALAKSRDQAPREFNGVTAHFYPLNPVLHGNEQLKIRWTLQNNSDQTVTFYHLGLGNHIRLYDRSKKEISLRMGAPIFEAAAVDVQLKPHQAISNVAQIDLKTFYDLPPGKYYFRFFYDLRLLYDDSMIERYRQKHKGEVWVPWDDQYYSFSIAK